MILRNQNNTLRLLRFLKIEYLEEKNILNFEYLECLCFILANFSIGNSSILFITKVLKLNILYFIVNLNFSFFFFILFVV